MCLKCSIWLCVMHSIGCAGENHSFLCGYGNSNSGGSREKFVRRWLEFPILIFVEIDFFMKPKSFRASFLSKFFLRELGVESQSELVSLFFQCPKCLILLKAESTCYYYPCEVCA